jgi:hypothetical protein
MPIAERLHVKVGAPFRGRDVSKVSTPEMRMITDEDWWSPEPPDTARREAPEVREERSRLPPIRPAAPFVRNNVRYRVIGGGGGVGGGPGHDPRWHESPLRPQEEVVVVHKEPVPCMRKAWFDFDPRGRGM